MDWTKQTGEMLKTWSETQKKLWDNWLETVQQGASKSQGTEIWQATINTWEETVKSMLEAQNEWVQTWARSFDTAKLDLPKELKEWADQAQDMMKQWSEAQQQLWQSWFEMIKQVNPARMSGDWGTESQKMYQTWQESALKMMEAQKEWVKMWAAGEAEKVKTSRKD
jgi:hypothetical protein